MKIYRSYSLDIGQGMSTFDAEAIVRMLGDKP